MSDVKLWIFVDFFFISVLVIALAVLAYSIFEQGMNEVLREKESHNKYENIPIKYENPYE